MELRKVVVCSKCNRPIVLAEGFGFVCFNISGKGGYHFFHRRYHKGDCWEAYLMENREKRELK